MSVVLICFPGAPKVSPEAVKREMDLDKYLENRVEGKCFVLAFTTTKKFHYIVVHILQSLAKATFSLVQFTFSNVMSFCGCMGG